MAISSKMRANIERVDVGDAAHSAGLLATAKEEAEPPRRQSRRSSWTSAWSEKSERARPRQRTCRASFEIVTVLVIPSV